MFASRFIDPLQGNWGPQWMTIPLRAIVGFGFLQHGYAKLARGGDSFGQILQALGVPLPHLLGWATIAVEILGGAAILLGALVALATIPMVIVLSYSRLRLMPSVQKLRNSSPLES